MPPPSHPLAAIMASENKLFWLTPENKELPSLQAFLRPFEDVLSVIASGPSLQFQFMVLQMPTAILHDDSSSALFEHVYRSLLVMGQSVALHIVSLQDHGIHQDRQNLVLIASPYPGLGIMGLHPETRPSADSSTLHELLGDLGIGNTHTACKYRSRNPIPNAFTSTTYSGDDENYSMAIFSPDGKNLNLYNHHTGRKPPSGHPRDCIHIIDNDGSEPVPLNRHSARLLVHKCQFHPQGKLETQTSNCMGISAR